MNLYLIERTDSICWDEFLWFVVAANNEQEVRQIVSEEDSFMEDIWLKEETRCLLIWTTEFYHKPTIILDSFNAW